LFGREGGRLELTIHAERATGAGTLTDFPVLVVIRDPGLRASATQDGNEIAFVANDGRSALAQELEQHDPATGDLVAWVRIPSLSLVASTTIFLTVGHRTPADPPAASAVWDESFAAIWHMTEDPAGSAPQLENSTTHANDLSTDGASTRIRSVEGRVGHGLDFPGGADAEHARRATSPTLELTGDQFTLEAWVLAEPGGWDADHDAGLISKGPSTNGERYHLGVNSDGSVNVRRFSGTLIRLDTAGGEVPEGDWTYVAGTYDGSALRAFVNGVQAGALDASGVLDVPGSGLRVGARWDERRYSGWLDEVRISHVARSAEWLEVTYLSISDPAEFVTLGPAS
jgi:hypothetical protein